MKDVAQRIGQLLIVGFDGTSMSTGLSSLLTRIQPAGVILFARNIVSAGQTHQLLKDCQACVQTPLFTCVDMEGGLVDRLKNAIGPAPSAAEVFATADRRLFRKHGRIIGETCRATGFNTDLAPTVDLALEESKSVMRSRTVSEDPKLTVRYAREFLAGLATARVLGAAKHFPGLGGATLDTHHELPAVKRSLRKLWEEDMYPYRAMRRELRMVLVGHANYPDVTKDHKPASLSKKWLTDILRKRVGYQGLILSDDLEMGGVLKAAPIERASVEHIRAGGDLCLLCHKEEGILKSYQELVRETESDGKFRTRVEDSLSRIATFKRKSRELRRWNSSPTKERVEDLSRKLWEFGEQVRLHGLAKGATTND
jgi:beta-N-acetylhexosaminidase